MMMSPSCTGGAVFITGGGAICFEIGAGVGAGVVMSSSISTSRVSMMSSMLALASCFACAISRAVSVWGVTGGGKKKL